MSIGDFFPKGGGGVSGPAGGDLGGTFPNPTVTDDSHAHTLASLPTNLATGPASATDNAAARFDGVGGKTLQNSALVVTDAGEAQIGAGSATNPSWSYSGDPNTGFFSMGGDVQRLTIAGTERFRWDGNASGRCYVVGDGNFPGILGSAKSATAPNLCPDAVGDENTGIGTPAADQLSIAAGGSEVARFVLATNPYAMLRAHNAAIADGSVPTSFVAVYLNEAGNLLTFKVKYSDGTTIKTGTVALV